MKRETRTYSAKLEARDLPGEPRRISGYAARFGVLSADLGGFKERIAPGTFSRAISENQDVRCLFNHSADHILGRTKSGTLRLKQDSNGLFFEADLPDTQDARDLFELIKRQDIAECSFSFDSLSDSWGEEKDADGKSLTVRTLRDVNLFDVSPCVFAAYPEGTSVAARNQIAPETRASAARYLATDETLPRKIRKEMFHRLLRSILPWMEEEKNFAVRGLARIRAEKDKLRRAKMTDSERRAEVKKVGEQIVRDEERVNQDQYNQKVSDWQAGKIAPGRN